MAMALLVLLHTMMMSILFFCNVHCQYDNANQFGVPAMLIFGDSTVDAGNNNGLTTIMHGDHLPYGKDFGFPSGRFSNGLLAPDFIARRLNLPFPVAYSSPNATGSNLIFGANFASAASGFVDSTANLFNVVSFTKQLRWFDTYRTQLKQVVGDERAQSILSKALYVISSGSNDYIYYGLNQRMSSQYNSDQFRDLLINQASTFMKELYKVGARRMAVISLSPLGCLPSVITSAGLSGSSRNSNRQCIQDMNQKAEAHNLQLQGMLSNAKTFLPQAKIAYLDSYSVLYDAIHNPAKYGFSVENRGCCGSGLIEVGDLCTPLSRICDDSTKYVFWDSFHPTQTMYKIVADVFYSQAIGVLT